VDDLVDAVDEPQLRIDTDLADVLELVRWPSELVRLLDAPSGPDE
jgi:hypothetical protein